MIVKHNRLYDFIRVIITILAFSVSTLSADETITKNDILIQEGNLSVTRQEARSMLADMTWEQKQKLLNNDEKFKNLLLDFLSLKKQQEAALQKNLDKTPSAEWKLTLSKARILSKALINDFRNDIPIPESLEKLAREKYDSQPEKYTIDEKVSVSHILLKVSADQSKEDVLKTRNRAIAIIEELNNGLDFSKAAKKYSEDKGSAGNGGLINYFKRGQMVPAFETAAFAMDKVDEISSSPIQSKFGFHILKFLGRIEASTIPFEKTKAKLIGIERKKYLTEKTNEFLDTFNTNSKTNIFVTPFNGFIKAEKNKLQKHL